MTQIYQNEHVMPFYAANRYPSSNVEAHEMGLSGKRNAEMRAMTIAAFRVCQNESDINGQEMDADLLHFLLAGSDTAIYHWAAKGRLTVTDSGYSLTQEGLDECRRSLAGEARGYNTSEGKVQEWVNRMLRGDGVAIRLQRCARLQ